MKREIQAEILTWDELTPNEQEIVLAAIGVRRHAQAPYSGYHVGAALWSVKKGTVYSGCNVECASYSQTTHAEQSAIAQMVAQEGSGAKIAWMAVAGAPKDVVFDYPVQQLRMTGIAWQDIHPSCGHCLQIIWENCAGDPRIPILQVFPGGLVVRTAIGDAFPFRFGPSELGIDLTKK